MYKIITGSVSHFKKVTFMSLQKLLHKNYVLCLFDCIGNNRIFFFKLLHNKQKKTTKNSNKSTYEEGSHKVQKKIILQKITESIR